MNICKIKSFAKSTLALSLPLALCFSLNGCSFVNNFFDSPQLEESSKSESLLSSIPAPKQTSYSYAEISNEHIKNLYAQIENECHKLTPQEIQCTGLLTEKDIYEAIVAFKNDHPDVFWLKNTFTYYEADDTTHIELSYISSGSELAEQKEKFNNALNNFLSNATMYYSEYDREKYVNDYIVENCEYDTKAAQNNNIMGYVSSAYGVLVEGKAICEGYARTFQLLCNKMGIECVSIAGKADNVGHEWNCAYIDGEWYQVDVTWNDTGNDMDKYDYFNLTDEQMYSSHKADKLFSEMASEFYKTNDSILGNLYVPECNSTEYNYYRQTAPILYGFDEENDDTITDSLVNSAKSGEKYFSIIIDSSLDYDDAYSKLVNEAYVVNYIDKANSIMWGETKLSTSSYAYKNETLRVITIELNYVD